jgi:hydroxypyruvate isomerase
MKKLIWVLLTIVLTLNVGCAERSVKLNHPNALNRIDDKAYDQLIILQSVIESLKPEVQASGKQEYKDALNKAIFSYNAALNIYKAYHEQQASGDVQAAIENVMASIREVQLLMGKQALRLEATE